MSERRLNDQEVDQDPMKNGTSSLLLSICPLILVMGYHNLMPQEYPRVGMLAGLAAGVVFGITAPVENQIKARLHRAIRTALAFGVTTGVGYGFYQSTGIGISWGLGGTLGCVAGGLMGQFGRSLFVNESLEGD